MTKLQASYLSKSVALVTFLAATVLFYFAAAASKNALVFFLIAVFFALSSVFWTYRYAKDRRTLQEQEIVITVSQKETNDRSRQP